MAKTACEKYPDEPMSPQTFVGVHWMDIFTRLKPLERFRPLTERTAEKSQTHLKRIKIITVYEINKYVQISALTKVDGNNVVMLSSVT